MKRKEKILRTGVENPSPVFYFSFLRIIFLEGFNLFLGLIFLRRVVIPSPKIVINLPRSYPVKENHIGLAFCKILQYKQIDIHKSCYFIIRIIYVDIPLLYRPKPTRNEDEAFINLHFQFFFRFSLGCFMSSICCKMVQNLP